MFRRAPANILSKGQQRMVDWIDIFLGLFFCEQQRATRIANCQVRCTSGSRFLWPRRPRPRSFLLLFFYRPFFFFNASRKPHIPHSAPQAQVREHKQRCKARSRLTPGPWPYGSHGPANSATYLGSSSSPLPRRRSTLPHFAVPRTSETREVENARGVVESAKAQDVTCGARQTRMQMQLKDGRSKVNASRRYETAHVKA
jgi:hypothetical protein